METSPEQFTGICTTQNSWLNFTDIKNRAIWFEINGPKNVKNNNSENSLIRKKNCTSNHVTIDLHIYILEDIF